MTVDVSRSGRSRRTVGLGSRAVMCLSWAQERALLAACDGRLCMCGLAIWVDREAQPVALVTVDWLEWEDLIQVDWDEVLAAGVLHGPAHHPIATRMGRARVFRPSSSLACSTGSSLRARRPRRPDGHL